jgi:serine protease Do
MSDFVDIYRLAIVQIATPFSTGTGFYLKTPGLIATNHHVVEGSHSVVIEGAKFPKQLAHVRYIDRTYDLAFLQAPADAASDIPDLVLADKTPREHEPVTAIGHPFGLRFSVKTGIVSNAREVMNNVPYLHIDVALNPGNSGGPLVNERGEVVGINTFIIRNGNNVGFSLPVSFLRDTLAEFQGLDADIASRCTACHNLVTPKTVDNGFCTYCGNKVSLPPSSDDYNPSGVPKTVEALIAKLGYDVALSRSGPNAWEIRHGSAKILITYHEKTGLISADAILCQLPKENIKALYEYMLRENYTNEALTLAVHEQDILLSLLIYDRYLNDETGGTLLSTLFEKADYYDNVLVEQYGARWKVEE